MEGHVMWLSAAFSVDLSHDMKNKKKKSEYAFTFHTCRTLRPGGSAHTRPPDAYGWPRLLAWSTIGHSDGVGDEGGRSNSHLDSSNR